MSNTELSDFDKNVPGTNGVPKRLAPPPDLLEWELPSGPHSASVPGRGFSAYVHAFRRRWLVAVSLGLLCSVLAGVAGWYFHTPTYAAVATLRMASSESSIVLQTGNHSAGADFSTFKSTQSQFLKSYLVVERATQLPEVAGLQIVKSQPDIIGWLEKELRVSFPGGGEIMEVRLQGKPGLAGGNLGRLTKELAVLVDAVVKTYVQQIAAFERQQRDSRLRNLKYLRDVQEAKVRQFRNDLQAIPDGLSNGKSESQSLEQQFALSEWTAVAHELTEVQMKLMMARAASQPPEGKPRTSESQPQGDKSQTSDSAETDSMVTAQQLIVPGTEVTDAELDLYALTDPETVNLTVQLNGRRHQLEINGQRFQSDSDTVKRDNAEIEAQIKTLQDKIAARREELRPRILAQRQAALLGSNTGVESVFMLERMKKQLDAEAKIRMEKARDAANRARDAAKPSIEVDLMRQQLDIADDQLKRIRTEIETIELEQKAFEDQKDAAAQSSGDDEGLSASRVQVLSKAVVPGVDPYENLWRTLAATSLFGFCVPVMLVTWWDARARRINSVDEVVDGIGLNVLGSIPHVPAREIRRLNGSSGRKRYWQGMLTESVDAIAAGLLRRVEQDLDHVILVSSAMPGEGKSTLAVQMARSLSQSGRKTLVVDFDLRRPSLHRVFDLHLQPGVSELLWDPELLPKVLQRDSSGELYVLTAGRAARNPLAASTQEGVAELFKTLRSEFEFVVVDCSPILPAVDTRLLVQHMDAVILSVLRDVSEAPKLIAACEVLEAFGAHVIGAVVTGVDTEGYYRDSRYVNSQPV